MPLFAAGGILEWPPNISSTEFWVEAIEDKGGASTKLILKFINVARSDSVYHTQLLGMLDRVKDSYEFLSIAFGPLYDEISDIRRRGLCIRSVWRQRLPAGFYRREGDDYPMEISKPMPLLNGPAQQQAIQCLNAAVRKRRTFTKSPLIPGEIKKPPEPPKRLKSAVPAQLPFALPLSLPGSSSPAAGPGARVKLLRYGAGGSQRPLGLASSSSLLPSSALPGSIPKASLPSASVPSPGTRAASVKVEKPISPVPMQPLVCASGDVDDPPVEERPDCECCTFEGGFKPSRRGIKVDGCPTALREAQARNPTGPVRPKLQHGLKTAPRLVGCTWSSCCPTCLADADGQLSALRLQWGECSERSMANRRIRFFFGGDYMSQGEPMGHGGPSSKKFCLFCLAVLHETNAAGIPHLPTIPEGYEETREPSIAAPAPRAGSFAFAYQAASFAQAKLIADRDGSRQPEAMDFDSCIRRPLIYTPGPPIQSFSVTPLHLFLGLSLEQVRLLEWELKELDAEWAAAQGTAPSLPAKESARLLEMEAQASSLTQQIAQLEADLSKHSNAMELIESDEANAAAVLRGKKEKSRKKDPPPALPFELEYRGHRKALAAAQQAKPKAEGELSKLQQEIVKLYSQVAGPFMRSFYELMDSFNLERKAYHSGALPGNDCEKIFRPDVCEKFAALLNRKRVSVDLSVSQKDAEPPYVHISVSNIAGLGDNQRAKQFADVWHTLGEAASLWTRHNPLCEHEIVRFRQLRERLAIGYAELYPAKEPPPKMHVALYHVYEQLLWLGSTGQLHEGVVEAFHVIDNRHTVRWANVKNPEQNITMRARAAWQLQHPSLESIRKFDREREELRRGARTRHMRMSYAEWERTRQERLDREGEAQRARAQRVPPCEPCEV